MEGKRREIFIYKASVVKVMQENIVESFCIGNNFLIELAFNFILQNMVVSTSPH